MKQYFSFQWHITDECDQRCKHCYIFRRTTVKTGCDDVGTDTTDILQLLGFL